MRVGVTSRRVSLPIQTSIRPSAASREDWRRSARSLPVGGPFGGSWIGVSVGTGGEAEGLGDVDRPTGPDDASPGPQATASAPRRSTPAAARSPERTAQNDSSESRDGRITSTLTRYAANEAATTIAQARS